MATPTLLLAGLVLTVLLAGWVWVWRARDPSQVELLAELDRMDPEGRKSRPVRIAVCVLRLGTVVAAAGSPLSTTRVDALMHLFLGPATQEEWLPILGRAIAEARQGVDVDGTLATLVRWTEPSERHRIFQALREVASSGGGPTPEAVKVLLVIMVKLGLPDSAVQDFIDEAAGGSSSASSSPSPSPSHRAIH